MSQDDHDGRKRKNPWGNSNDQRPNNPWGGPGSGGNNEHPDLDEVLKKAQEGLRDILPGNMNGGIAVLALIAIVVALWLSSGFYIVNPGEHGVIQRFGAWERTQAQEGLDYHFPAPIETVTKVNVNALRKMNIGFTELSSRGRGPSQKREVPEESLMLTSDRNIVDLHMVIQWDIKSAEEYLFQIQDQENTVKKVAQSAIREVVGQTEMFPIITTGRALISTTVKDIIQKNLDEYHSGVNIRQVLIQKAEVHPDVQKAFQDVQSAKQDAEDTQNQARAVREDILPKARGLAEKINQEAEAYEQSQVAKAQGDAERFLSIYKAYLSGKDVTKERIYIETMESVLSNAQKIILDSNGGNQGVVPYLPLDELKSKSNKKISQ
jgi:membrane protease subunit HflK